MKIIFLGVDGVLNNSEIKKKLAKKGAYDFNKCYSDKSLDLLKRLVDVSNAHVVITSSLRSDIKDLKWRTLKNKLKSKEIPIYGVTGIFDGKSRESEIHEYMKQLSLTGSHIESFVILDNGEHELSSYKNNLVITRSGVSGDKDGFKHKHFIKAMKILMGENFLYTEGEE